VAYGQSLRIAGSCESLGAWNPWDALQLEWSDLDVWVGSAEIPKGGEFCFKVVTAHKDGYLAWDDGENCVFATDGEDLLLSDRNGEGFKCTTAEVVQHTQEEFIASPSATAVAEVEWLESYSEGLNKRYWYNRRTYEIVYERPAELGASAISSAPAVLSSAMAPPPSDWVEEYSSGLGKRYWHNTKTLEIVYEQPVRTNA